MFFIMNSEKHFFQDFWSIICSTSFEVQQTQHCKLQIVQLNWYNIYRLQISLVHMILENKYLKWGTNNPYLKL